MCYCYLIFLIFYFRECCCQFKLISYKIIFVHELSNIKQTITNNFEK